MLRKLTLFFASLAALHCQAQGPTVTSWLQNTTATGYAGILTNVQLVQFDTNYCYISATCIPGYSIGPWPGNPNVPANKNFVYKIPRHPAPNTGTLVNVPMGQVGAWSNGVSVFNALDARSYNNQGIWNQNAYFFEGSGFDNCLGHPAPDGQYHHHVSPKCLYSTTDSTHHSPIIGYAWDGYPIYGAYGYADTSIASGTIKRMKSSFVPRNITQRHVLPDGTTLTASNYGPDVSTTYPVGAYREDYLYTVGAGDLDEHNGRWCHTPEYPAGTYAYFVTIDASLTPTFPYTLGTTYYGTPEAADYGPSGGHVTPPGGTVIYTGGTTGIAINSNDFTTEIFPNPAADQVNLYMPTAAGNNFEVTITDMAGRVAFTQKNVQPTILYSFNVSALRPGMYQITIKNDHISRTEKLLIRKQ